MTNQDVINACESEKYHLVCISPEMDEFIKANYKEGNDNGKFYKVYRRGNDAKYGHYMINPILCSAGVALSMSSTAAVSWTNKEGRV